LDCGPWVPYQKFGVDWHRRVVFGLKPNNQSQAKFWSLGFVSAPTRWRYGGDGILRQNIGCPWFGVVVLGINQTAPKWPNASKFHDRRFFLSNRERPKRLHFGPRLRRPENKWRGRSKVFCLLINFLSSFFKAYEKHKMCAKQNRLFMLYVFVQVLTQLQKS
jgi:hypothetical protein